MNLLNDLAVKYNVKVEQIPKYVKSKKYQSLLTENPPIFSFLINFQPDKKEFKRFYKYYQKDKELINNVLIFATINHSINPFNLESIIQTYGKELIMLEPQKLGDLSLNGKFLSFISFLKKDLGNLTMNLDILNNFFCSARTYMLKNDLIIKHFHSFDIINYFLNSIDLIDLERVLQNVTEEQLNAIYKFSKQLDEKRNAFFNLDYFYLVKRFVIYNNVIDDNLLSHGLVNIDKYPKFIDFFVNNYKSSLSNKINMLLSHYLKCSLTEIECLHKIYMDYCQNKNLNKEQKEFVNIMQVIYKSENNEQLLENFSTFAKQNVIYSYLADLAINIRHQEYRERLLDPKQLTASQQVLKEVRTINLNGESKEVECFVLKGLEFEGLYHCITDKTEERSLQSMTYEIGKNLLNNPHLWNNANGTNYISMSFNNEKTLNRLFIGNPRNAIVLGFGKINDKQITSSYVSDHGTSMSIGASFASSVILESKKELLENYNPLDMRWNEVVSKRENINPGYLLVSDNSNSLSLPTINENTLKWALNFKIPIVVIDTKTYCKKFHEELNNLYTKLKLKNQIPTCEEIDALLKLYGSIHSYDSTYELDIMPRVQNLLAKEVRSYEDILNLEQVLKKYGRIIYAQNPDRLHYLKNVVSQVKEQEDMLSLK